MQSSYSPRLTVAKLTKERNIKKSWLYERSRKEALPGQVRYGRMIRVDLAEFDAGVKAGELSPQTVKHMLRPMRQMFDLAIDWNYLRSNPAKKVHLRWGIRCFIFRLPALILSGFMHNFRNSICVVR